MQASIKDKYGLTARLKEGVGGIFEVFIDGKTVYTNKDNYRFPTDEEIFEQVDLAKKP
ncbi:MAG TPA: Rdx family protein [Candidatus Binatia bacterium]|nr:Rdx family protein [Candidatus Binatia bacterium]